VRIYGHVLGPTHAGLGIQNIQHHINLPPFAWITGSSWGAVAFHVVNTGNVIFDKAVANVWITNQFGQTVKTFPPAKISALLPGASLGVLEPIWKPLPLAGLMTVHVTVASTGTSATATSQIWIIPWILVIIIIIIVVQAVLLLWRGYFRKKYGRQSAGIEEVADEVPVSTGS
jgi:hypothetical protein